MCQKKRGLFVRPERTEHAVKLATSSPSFGNGAEKLASDEAGWLIARENPGSSRVKSVNLQANDDLADANCTKWPMAQHGFYIKPINQPADSVDDICISPVIRIVKMYLSYTLI